MHNTTLETVFSAHKQREHRARQAIRQDIAWLLNTPIPMASQPTEANVYATLPLTEITDTIRLSVDHL